MHGEYYGGSETRTVNPKRVARPVRDSPISRLQRSVVSVSLPPAWCDRRPAGEGEKQTQSEGAGWAKQTQCAGGRGAKQSQCAERGLCRRGANYCRRGSLLLCEKRDMSIGWKGRRVDTVSGLPCLRRRSVPVSVVTVTDDILSSRRSRGRLARRSFLRSPPAFNLPAARR